MAEIRVEPKRRSLAWLWILLILAVVAAAVWYFYFSGATASTADVPPAGTSLAPAPAFVRLA